MASPLQSCQLEATINKVRDAVFKKFSKKAGVPNIRQYEAKLEADLAQFEQHFSSLKREHAELEAEIEHVTNSLTEMSTHLERLEQKKQVSCVCLILKSIYDWPCMLQ